MTDSALHCLPVLELMFPSHAGRDTARNFILALAGIQRLNDPIALI